MAGATRPVGGGAYSSPRSEPGGQNTPRAGRSVATVGAYTVSLGLFAQQVDQGESYILPPTSYDLVIDVDNPVSHWKLGSVATAVDRKGVRNLPAIGGPIAVASGLIANNVSDQANQFVGTATQSFDAGAGTGFGTPYEGALTIEAWVKPTADADGYVVKRTPGTNLGFVNTGSGTQVQVQFAFEDSAGTSFSITTPSAFRLTLNQAYHVVGTYDGTTAILYINGVEAARTIGVGVGGVRSATTTPPLIGDARSGLWPQAVVDEVAWYSGALSPARVIAHYQAGNTGTTFFDSGSGTVTASGSGVESFQPPPVVYTDTGSGTVTASGSGVEGYVYTEAGSGTVTASGTGVESFQPPVIYNDNATINTPGLYDATVDVDTPVSHWKLGESGQATDRKGVQNLQAVSSPPTAESLVANNGSDAANSFDGARSPAIGQRFSVPQAAGVGTPYNTSTWSAELWIKAGSLAGTPDVLRRVGSVYAWVDTDGGVVWNFGSGGVSNGFVIPGRTAHLVMTFDGATGRGYLDGRLVHTTAGSVTPGNAAPIIGARVESGAINGTFQGTIDEVSWYNTALSLARVQAHYRAGLRYEIGSSGTSTESASFNDSGSGTVAASGSGTESSTYADSGSGTVTASGTRVESYVYTDSASGTVTASGTGVESYSPPPTAYDLVIDVDSPISHWKLGDPSTAVDRKGVRNLPAFHSPIAPAATLVANNGADSANTFVRATAQFFGTSTDPGIGAPYESPVWSIEAWFKVSSLGVTIGVAGRSDHQTIRVSSSNTIQLRWEDSSGLGTVVDSLNPAVVGTTYHVVGVFDGTNAILYVNGAENARKATTSRAPLPDAVPTIGSQNYGTPTAFDGTVDEVAWYTTVLSPARVLAHYQAGSPGTFFNDSGSGTVTASGTGTESSASADSSSGIATASGTGVESFTHSASGSGTATASGSGTESYTYDDSRSGTVTASGTSTESYAVSESASGTVTASGTGVEGYAYSDTGSGLVTVSGSGVESHVSAYTDSASGTVTASGSASESYAVSESASGLVTASGTGVESLTHSGSASGTATSSGTGTESDTHSASASGTVTASGTRVESAVFTDAASGTATASGTGVEKASRIKDAAVSLLGVGVVVVAARRARVGATSLLGTGTLAVSARRRRASSTALVGVGTLGVQARRNLRSSVALTGVASLHVVPAITGVEFGAVSLVGQGTLGASARRRRSSASTLTGVASLDADARRSRRAATALTGVGTLHVVPAITGVEFGAVSLVGSATLSASAKRQRASAVALVGVGTLDVDGLVVAVPQDVGAVSLIGTSSLSTRAGRRRSARVSLVGEGILTATPFVQKGRPWIVTGSTERLDATGVAGSVGRVWVVTGPVQRPDVRAAAGVVGRAGPNGQGSVDRPATIETGSIEWATTSP